MDEIELAEEAHRLRLKLLLAEEKEAAILLSLAANKVLFTVVRDPSPVSRAHTHTHRPIQECTRLTPAPHGAGGMGVGELLRHEWSQDTRVVTSCDNRATATGKQVLADSSSMHALPHRSAQSKIGPCAPTSKQSTKRRETSPCSPRSNPRKPRPAKNCVSATPLSPNPSHGR